MLKKLILCSLLLLLPVASQSAIRSYNFLSKSGGSITGKLTVQPTTGTNDSAFSVVCSTHGKGFEMYSSESPTYNLKVAFRSNGVLDFMNSTSLVFSGQIFAGGGLNIGETSKVIYGSSHFVQGYYGNTLQFVRGSTLNSNVILQISSGTATSTGNVVIGSTQAPRDIAKLAILGTSGAEKDLSVLISTVTDNTAGVAGNYMIFNSSGLRLNTVGNDAYLLSIGQAAGGGYGFRCSGQTSLAGAVFTGGSGIDYDGDSANNARIYSLTGGDKTLRMKTNNTDRVIISSIGCVAVGQTVVNNNAKLSVIGTSGSGTNNVVYFSTAEAGGNNFYIDGSGNLYRNGYSVFSGSFYTSGGLSLNTGAYNNAQIKAGLDGKDIKFVADTVDAMIVAKTSTTINNQLSLTTGVIEGAVSSAKLQLDGSAGSKLLYGNYHFQAAAAKLVAHANGVDALVINTSSTTINNRLIASSTTLTGQLSIKSYTEGIQTSTYTVASSTIDLSSSNVFDITLSSQTTSIYFTNPPSAGVCVSFTLILRQDNSGSRLVSWPASVSWGDNGAPILTTTAAKTDIITLLTVDGGTTYQGFLSGTGF